MNCNICKFAFERKGEKGNHLALECRRLPPDMHPNPNYQNKPQRFRVVEPSYWCGEFKELPKREVKAVEQPVPMETAHNVRAFKKKSNPLAD